MSRQKQSSNDDENGGYNARSLTTLEGLEGIRELPGMYIGSTDSRGLHHLIQEVVDNSIDEALAGYCDEIMVTFHPDGSVSVEDNGRGIPVDMNEDGVPGVQSVLTEIHSGGKFDDQSYKTSGGLHGVGISVVNALSIALDVTVKRDGHVWHQFYDYGIPTPDGDMNQLRELTEDETTGTKLRFWPDADVFDTVEFEYDRMFNRLRELAFLNPEVEIIIQDLRPEETKRESFKYDGGIREYVEYLNEGREEINDVIHFSGDGEVEEGTIEVEVAMQTTKDVQSSIHAFANNINTKEGGTHMTGFKTALTRNINDYANSHGLLGDIDGNLKGEDIREGVTAVISIKHPDPQFEGQTKTKLGNASVRGVTESVMTEGLQAYLNENPDEAEAVVQRAVQAAKVRMAQEKAQEVTRRDTPLGNTSLPGKLSDCQTKDPESAELFIVEGDSAGGSAKQGRDRANQAILPLKGKILNVEKHRLDRILENDQVRHIVQAIGAGIGDDFDIDDARYQNIIFLLDADVDGAHIRTLLLTLFYRHMPELLEEGYVYAAKPPLYRIRKGGTTIDVMNEEERDRVIEEEFDGSPDQVQRFKGLGEMNPEQLWDTTMKPETRDLKRLTVEDAAAADKMFNILMGDSVEPRKEFIKENAEDAEWVDI